MNVNILLADDAEINVRILESILRDSGYTFLKAFSGEQVLDILLNHEAAVILLDVKMPGMDGFQIAEKIRADDKTKDIPIVFITAEMKDKEYLIRGYALKAVDYILKPFDPNMLKTRVALLVELYLNKIEVRRQTDLLRRSEAELRDLLTLRNLELQMLEQEIRERKRVETELRNQVHFVQTLLNVAPMPIFFKNKEGNFQGCNKAFEEFIGIRKETLIGKKVFDIVPPDLAEIYHKMDEALFAQSDIQIYETQAQAADGSLRNIVLNKAVYADAAGEIGGLIGVITDITEIKKTKQLLEKHNIELEQSNQELDDFAYTVSHDLREPLRGIHNFSAFLMEDYAEKLDYTGKMMLETLSTLSKRLDDQILAILNYSRIGRADLPTEETDMNSLLRDVLDSLQFSLDESHVAVWIPRPLPAVRCDKVRIAEVFQNLISNAIKYNDKIEKWIEIGYNGDETKPVFYVRDNGIGIAEKHFKNIFKIFKRLHSKNLYGGGTGAGLTIVKKIIERHGGKIWLLSELSKGSTFYFTLEGETHERQTRAPDSDC
ncbi:MAG: hypothetical protein BWK80_12690 [Desulfobacteraceae bacterium IS3]|nr:MAG: hypothetical protein BWK80_12690 [Desulfobacteraceae bacterium IS3]